MVFVVAFECIYILDFDPESPHAPWNCILGLMASTTNSNCWQDPIFFSNNEGTLCIVTGGCSITPIPSPLWAITIISLSTWIYSWLSTDIWNSMDRSTLLTSSSGLVDWTTFSPYINWCVWNPTETSNNSAWHCTDVWIMQYHCSSTNIAIKTKVYSILFMTRDSHYRVLLS